MQRQDQSDKTRQINRTGGRLGVHIGRIIAHRKKIRMLEEGISSKRSLRVTVLGYQKIVNIRRIP